MLILAMVLLKPQTSKAVKSQDYGFYGIAQSVKEKTDNEYTNKQGLTVY